MECKNCGMYNQTSIVACQKCGCSLTRGANNVVYKPNTDVVYNTNTHSFEEFNDTINSLLRDDVQYNLYNQSIIQDQSNITINASIDQPKINSLNKDLQSADSFGSPNTTNKVNKSKQAKQFDNIRKQSSTPSQTQSVGLGHQTQCVYNNLSQQAVTQLPNQVVGMPHVQQPTQQVVDTTLSSQSQYVNYVQQPVYSGEYVQPQPVQPVYVPCQTVSSNNHNLTVQSNVPTKSISLIAFFAGVVGWLVLFVALIFEFNIKQSGLVSFVLGVAGILCVFLAYGMRQNKIWATVALVIVVQLLIYTSIVMLV